MKVEWKKLNTGRHNKIVVEQYKNGNGKRQNKNLNQCGQITKQKLI